MDPDPDAIITDFMMFMAKKHPGTVRPMKMPSGKTVFGPSFLSMDKLLAEYWETYQ